MNDEALFNARRLPARLTLEQTATLLGFHVDTIDHLVDIGLMEALGGVARGATKWFAAAYVEELARDVKWLAKATARIRQHNQRKNTTRKARSKGQNLELVKW